MLRVVRRLALITVILSASCAEPPNKEMNQAQGAIDAARAAGADRFAAAEFTAAQDALKRSEDAVAAGDYRQALSHALDSRERAQSAAKLAVEGRADARGQAERAVAEVATLLSRALAQLKDPDIARLNGRQLKEPRTTVAAAAIKLQEARTALKAEDYQGVAQALNGVAAELQAALTQIDAAASPRSSGRKR
jgi:HAMP domain-containing protein